MPDIFVNKTLSPIDAAPQTWGDLLDILDEHASRTGVLLTAARLDGVDLPAFRDPGVTVQRLSAVRRVDVDTEAPAAFLRQCVIESVASLEVMAGVAKELGGLYRSSDVSEGHEGLAGLALELGGLAALVGTLGGPLQIDLSSLAVNGRTVPQHVEGLGRILDSLVAAQESEDWLTVADVLEYDLEPAVRGWKVVLETLAAHLGS
jgi:hypothetical protein